MASKRKVVTGFLSLTARPKRTDWEVVDGWELCTDDNKRSKMTPICDKNTKSGTDVLPHFGVICDLFSEQIVL